MWKSIMSKLFWWFTGVLTGLFLGLDIVFARSIDMSKAGVSLWIFVVVGAFIILLQLVPAIILFSTVIGTITRTMQKSIPTTEQEDMPEECCKEKE